jgi:geranylgeranyl diphosphate synthase type 3
MIHGIRQNPIQSQLLHILRQRPTNDAVKTFAVEHLEAMGSFKHCRRTICRLVAEAKLIAAEFGGDELGRVQEILEFLEFE